MVLNFNTRIEITNNLPKSGSIKEQKVIYSLNKRLLNEEYLKQIEATPIETGYSYNLLKDTVEFDFNDEEKEVLKSIFELLDKQEKFPLSLVPLLDII